MKKKVIIHYKTNFKQKTYKAFSKINLNNEKKIKNSLEKLNNQYACLLKLLIFTFTEFFFGCSLRYNIKFW